MSIPDQLRLDQIHSAVPPTIKGVTDDSAGQPRTDRRSSDHRVAVLDDYQAVALTVTDWSVLGENVTVTGFPDHLAEADQIVRRLEGFDVVVAMRERTPFPRSLLERLPSLRLLVTTGMRNQSIDLEAAAELGVVVSGTDLVPTSTVELTWALILAVVRDTCGEDRRTRAGQWQRFVPLDLAGSTLGIIGLGKLGSQVAAIALGFGMEVVAWSPHLTPERAAANGAVSVGLDELLERSDIVSVHVPLNDGSRGLIGSAELQRIGRTGYLVNTSRGPIVDQDALVEALQTGIIAGAGLDVFDVEPLPNDHPLLSTPRTVLSPHMGFVSKRSLQIGYTGAVEDVLAWMGGTPIRVLNGPVS
jgi:phosphoglycerate dehydrogenase-like enzyme